MTERLSNAFDASLTAARRLAGYAQSDRLLTPRNAAQRFLNPNRDDANWAPQYKEISFQKPVIQFWKESEDEKHRFRKYNPGNGLATVLVRDTSLGIARERMPKTILELNSDDKLKTFEAIGQFGHGGSSALAFCESCLVISQPRFETTGNEFYWTLIFPEQEAEASKQSLVRKWFADEDGLPLIASLADFQDIAAIVPGTSLWHFGYNRGGWIKPISGPEQTNPWGRLGRLFFFLTEAWQGIEPLLKRSAILVCRIGTMHISYEDLKQKLRESVRTVWPYAWMMGAPRVSELKNSQTGIIRPGAIGCKEEYDFKFRLS